MDIEQIVINSTQILSIWTDAVDQGITGSVLAADGSSPVVEKRSIAAELFTELNQFPGDFISLHKLPFPKLALQPILLRNMNIQIGTENADMPG